MTGKATKKKVEPKSEDLQEPLQPVTTEPLEPNAKKLTVTLRESRKPEFSFAGDWTGKDTLVIMRHIRMAYHTYKRDCRRLATTPITSANEKEGAVK